MLSVKPRIQTTQEMEKKSKKVIMISSTATIPMSPLRILLKKLIKSLILRLKKPSGVIVIVCFNNKLIQTLIQVVGIAKAVGVIVLVPFQ